MNPRTSARLMLISAAVLWSTSGVLLKSIPDVHWLVIAGARSAFGLFIFLPGFWQPRPPARKLAPGILLYVILVSTLMGAMQLGTAAQGIWLQYLAPAVVALWAWRVQQQRLRPAETAAVVLTVIALGLIVTGGNGRLHVPSVLLGVVSGFAFGGFILLLKSLGDTPPASIFVWTNLGTALVLLPLAVALGIPLPTLPREWLVLAVMGVGQLCLPYYFFKRAVVHARAVEASLIALLEPILNPIWVYLVVAEVPSPRTVAGCALIAVGLVAFALSPRERNG
jgi:drug/metabolite transporter (DMT)-like permease